MHNPEHGHDRFAGYNRAFGIGIALNLVFILIEAGFGFLSGSLALLSDAGHNLSDVLGLVLAWGAFFMASRKTTPGRTYGFRRLTILSSVLSSVILLVAVGYITWEAIGRFFHPQPVDGRAVLIVAGIGTVINAGTALLFISHKDKDLNLRGAYLHMAADAGVSLGVVMGGLAIAATGWMWLDPTISLLIGALILIGTWGLLRDSFNLLIDAVPRDIDPTAVRRFLAGLKDVTAMHDLHIWPLSTTQTALTVHLVVNHDLGGDAFLKTVSLELDHRFGIDHATIQIEIGESKDSCPLNDAEKDRDGSQIPPP